MYILGTKAPENISRQKNTKKMVVSSKDVEFIEACMDNKLDKVIHMLNHENVNINVVDDRKVCFSHLLGSSFCCTVFCMGLANCRWSVAKLSSRRSRLTFCVL